VILKPHGHGGHTTRQTTAWCCTCEDWIIRDAPATAQFKRAGWRKTKHGWQCKGCRKENEK
jgi:hypothetical protein